MHCCIVDMKSEYSCSFFMQQMLLNMLGRVMYWFRFFGKDKNMVRRVKFKDDCKQSCWLYLCFVLVALESNSSSFLMKCIFRCNSPKVLDYEYFSYRFHFLYPIYTFFIPLPFCMILYFLLWLGQSIFRIIMRIMVVKLFDWKDNMILKYRFNKRLLSVRGCT